MFSSMMATGGRRPERIPLPDILGAATHEIGHTLGLYHTDVVGANMYWIFRRTMGLDDGWLHPDDIAGIRAIYGVGVGSVRPLPIPEPATWVIAIVAMFTLSQSVASGRHGAALVGMA